MARKRKAQAKYEHLRPDGRVDLMDEVVCIPCGCASGDGRPPAVGECACRCHDSPRLWWSMRPYRAEPCLSQGHDWVDVYVLMSSAPAHRTTCARCGAEP